MKTKKMFALIVSTAMIMGTSMPVMADDEVSVTAPVYSFEVLDVVVPTTYEVAFNPEKLTVTTGTGASDTSNAQILSRNYGIINKGNKDQIFTVTLKVEDQNNGKIKFATDNTEVGNATSEDYMIHLQVIPADNTEVKVGTTPASATGSTTAADLNAVSMTAATSAAQTLNAGENRIAFKLDKAKYDPKTGDEVTLGTSNSNNVKENYQLASLAGSGKGITAFTFGGTMNENANWSKLTSGIKITAVYNNKIAPTNVSAVSGAGAMVEVPADITLSANGEIKITEVDAADYGSMSINDGTQDWAISDADGTWNEWNEPKDGKKEFVLGDVWMDFLDTKTATVKLTLKDGSTITSSPITIAK